MGDLLVNTRRLTSPVYKGREPYTAVVAVGRAGRALVLAALIGLSLACVMWWRGYIRSPVKPPEPGERYVFHRLGPLADYLVDPSAIARPIRVSYEDFGGKYYLFLPFKRPLPVWVEGKGFIQLMDVRARFLNVSREEDGIEVVLYLDRPFIHRESYKTEHVKGFFDAITYKPSWKYGGKNYVLVSLNDSFDDNEWNEEFEKGTYWGLSFHTKKVGKWITLYPGVWYTSDTLAEIKKRKVIGVMILVTSPEGLMGEVDLSKAWLTYTEVKK